jgi:amino acid transporter
MSPRPPSRPPPLRVRPVRLRRATCSADVPVHRSGCLSWWWEVSDYAAGALPLSVIFALVACLLVAISIGQLARRLPSAGGFYTYAARGLHPAVGFLVGWGSAFVEPLVAPLPFLIFGNVVAGTLNQEFGWSYDTWWVVAALAAAVTVFVLGYCGVRLSTGAGTVLGLFEILVFAGLALSLIVKAGDANTLSCSAPGSPTSRASPASPG